MVVRSVSRRDLLKGAAAGAGVLLLDRVGPARAAAAVHTASTTPPYILPLVEGVDITAILTVGEAAANGYRMVGIPDGLGVMEDDQNLTVLMNHELRSTVGVVRAHGSKGAFVSRWTIDRRTLQVVEGSDLIRSPRLWDTATRTYTTGTTAFDRFCSADLPAPTALRHGSRGTDERIFFNGEEVAGGRAFAHVATGPEAGQSWQLPRLGRMGFENLLASPHGKDTTIIVGLEDASIITAPNPAASEMVVYVGDKRSTGTTLERAGLTDGRLFGVRVRRGGVVVGGESNAYGFGDAGTGLVTTAHFDLVELGPGGDVSALTAAQLEADETSKNVFRFQRTEDGAWDPRSDRQGDFYFVTTADMASNTRLWRLRFDDLRHPEAGGTIEILVSNLGCRMFDNVCVDRLGRVLIQEDPGNDPHLAKIWLYGSDTQELIAIAQHDPARFGPGVDPARFITQDEETSGIIDATDALGRGWFLLVDQAHKASADPELVSGGQFLAMHVDPRIGRRSDRGED
jgi:hypothetical protein